MSSRVGFFTGENFVCLCVHTWVYVESQGCLKHSPRLQDPNIIQTLPPNLHFLRKEMTIGSFYKGEKGIRGKFRLESGTLGPKFRLESGTLELK